MKWLIRTAVALGLLACLGYASYAFGMFVLSKKLFGDSVMQNSASEVSRSATVTKSVTRKSRDKNAQAGAEVNVLDARDAGPGPQAPSLDALERETRARDYDAPRAPSRQRIISADSLKTIRPKRDFSDDNSSAREGANSQEERPRKRRRRRRRRSTSETTTTSITARNDSATPSDSSSSSGDASTRDTSSSSSGDSSSSSSSERPRRRESSSDSGSSSRRERRIESPVPGGSSKSSSGGSGSESPVPVPE